MFEDKEEKGREEIIDYALKLSRAGLNVNSSGNLSVRFDSPEGKGFLITPTGLPYDETFTRRACADRRVERKHLVAGLFKLNTVCLEFCTEGM